MYIDAPARRKLPIIRTTGVNQQEKSVRGPQAQLFYRKLVSCVAWRALRCIIIGLDANERIHTSLDEQMVKSYFLSEPDDTFPGCVCVQTPESTLDGQRRIASSFGSVRRVVAPEARFDKICALRH